MEIKFKIYNLDIPNRNGYIYSKEAIEGMYDKCRCTNIPIVLRDGCEDIYSDNIIGYGNIIDVNYPEVECYANIHSELINEILKKKIGGFTMYGLGSVNTAKNDKVIHDYKLEEFNYFLNPSQATSFEIIENGIIGVDLAKGEDFTNEKTISN